MKWYRLVFKQEQPIHIGALKWGVMNETEIFIPGWTMWGALTSQFLKFKFGRVRDKEENEGKVEYPPEVESCDIERFKKFFECITNFYPALRRIEKEDESRLFEPLFPHYKRGIFHLGGYSEERFRFEFVDTFVSTAVEPLSRGAKDESLHEIEYILPQSNVEQLYWVGLLGFEEEQLQETESFLKELLEIYVGGDSRYGFGRLTLTGIECLNDEDEEGKSEDRQKSGELAEWGLDKNGCLCRDENDDNLVLRQFLECSPEIKFEGEIKLIADFDFAQNIPRAQEAKYYINVGSKVKITDVLSSDEELRKYRLFKGKFIRIKT
ncbi:hypothetical protein [Caldicoprobacter faecalis]|uniref:Uncharacterized protein n=1 Tax=Caldicoprobacter faecalis TaxID=937334 RepID=A0A1I5WHX7_9FIRM|nr:hypothetical protein [Caldicoprobacter faecalis]SFQ19374.1 hypothetical protein SAMN05444406_11712 [Caldicoprobacter faecalis]